MEKRFAILLQVFQGRVTRSSGSNRVQTIQEGNKRMVGVPRTTGCLITAVSVIPGSAGRAHVPVLVPLCFLKNTARASSASAVISPNPPGYAGPCWRRRACDNGRSALRATDTACHGASWHHTSVRCSGPLAGFHFSAIPFEEAAFVHLALSASSSVEAFPRPSWLTCPTTA